MNTESVDKALEATENALRDFIQEVLEKKFGEQWLEKSGIVEKRILQWEEWRDKEKKKDVSGIAEGRIIYYSDFGDLRRIINSNWKLFKSCFGYQNRIDFYLKELKAFRDTDAHRRELLTHQRQLILGYCGAIRTAITKYRSKEAPEGEYFPHIEYAKDSFGNIVKSKRDIIDTCRVLIPGDEVEFVVVAWDPLDKPLQYRYAIIGRDIIGDPSQFGVAPDGSLVPNDKWVETNRAIWKVHRGDISVSCFIQISIRSTRPYHSTGGYDDSVTFIYKVLPKQPPKRKT